MRIASSAAERRAAADVMGAAFSADEPALANRARRLACARRASADWWVAVEDRDVVGALLSYPLSFGLPSGEARAGFGLGAVATRPDRLRRGVASALCRAAIEHEHARGRAVGLLFSAIDRAYYERMGFVATDAWEHEAARLAELAASGAAAELFALDPRRAAGALADVYATAHAGRLHLARDAEAWERTLVLEPDTWWLGLGGDGEREPLRGYARVRRCEELLVASELVLSDPADEGSVLRALAQLALELGCERFGCWLPPSPFVATWFEDRGRAETLPMVAGLAAADLRGARFWGSDYF